MSVVITIWIVTPAFCTAMAVISTGFIEGVCVPWGLFSNWAESIFFCTSYLLPLSLMIFCYSRIVYSLRTKVTCSVYTRRQRPPGWFFIIIIIGDYWT